MDGEKAPDRSLIYLRFDSMPLPPPEPHHVHLRLSRDRNIGEGVIRDALYAWTCDRLIASSESENISMTTNSTSNAMPSIVSSDEWKSALDTLTEKETAHFDAQAALNAERRRLPMVEVTTPYSFEGPDGPISLADLFQGQRQLVLYHFMFAPEWKAGCPDCTSYANGIGNPAQMRKQDIEFAFVSRAPVEKIEAYRKRMGWVAPWYSCETAFSEDMGALSEGSDFPAINVFLRDDDGKVYRTYYSNGSAIEATIGQAGLMNMTPFEQ